MKKVSALDSIRPFPTSVDFVIEALEREEELATPRDAMREFAAAVGGERPDQAWILTDYDVWIENPHYRGPAVPHPESEEALEELS